MSAESGRTVTEEPAREMERQLNFEFLAEASRLLAASLDYETTLSNVAQLAVSRLADWCIIDVLEEQGTVSRLATAHVDPVKMEIARRFQERYQPTPQTEEALMTVLRTGRSRLVPVISQELMESRARDEEHLRIIREMRPLSYMRVPMSLHDRTVGAITFVSAESGRIYDESDLELAEDLARRAALAVENARLYSEVRAALRARDDFLSTVSHDLKNPLTTIKGQAQILQRRAQRLGEPAEGLMRGLETIESIATRMNRMINDLVDVAHVRGGGPLELNRQPTDLVALTRQVTGEYAQTTRRHTLQVESPLDTLVGAWDPPRLERVIANLVSNAIKFSPDGGQISIAVGRDGDDAVLIVRDQGLGIPDEDLPHVFDRFHRGRNVSGRIAGTGIGLAGTKHNVEQHGGRVEVESREGEGSTFTVRLPLWPSVAEPRP